MFLISDIKGRKKNYYIKYRMEKKLNHDVIAII